jgi:hypothetical protein
MTALPAFADDSATAALGGLPASAAQSNVPSVTAPKADAATAAPLRDWTVMVYINAKNNLEKSGLYNVAQMEAAGSTDRVNVVVELGRMNGQQGDVHDDGDWTGARRYLIAKSTVTGNVDADPITLYSPVLYSTASADMGDYREVEQFVSWSRHNFPARHYMLLLWDHGSGWMDPQKKTARAKALDNNRISPNGISFDNETSNFIGTVEIGKIARDIGGVDVFGYDACLMQMAEVLGEVGSSAQYSLGSEETVPGYGIDYTGFLNKLVAAPDATPKQAAIFAADAFHDFYYNNYSKLHQTATMSVVDDSALPGFEKTLDAWSAAAMKANDTAALKTARDGVLRFDEFSPKDPNRMLSTYGDAYHFMQLVQSAAQNQELKQASRNVMDYISGKLVVKSTAVGKSGNLDYEANAHGIAINIPRVRGDITNAQLEDKYFGNKYTDFAFSKDTSWNAFFNWMAANMIPPKPAAAAVQK